MQHQLRRARVRQRAQHHDWADKAQVAKDEKAAAGRESGGASIAVAAASWSVASKQPKKKMVDMSPRRQRQEQAQQQQPQQQQQQAEDEGAAVVQVTVEFQTADVRAAGPPQAINAFSLRALNVHGALRALPHAGQPQPWPITRWSSGNELEHSSQNTCSIGTAGRRSGAQTVHRLTFWSWPVVLLPPGTHAPVWLQLHGEGGTKSAPVLFAPAAAGPGQFGRGATDRFEFVVPRTLGALRLVQVGHDVEAEYVDPPEVEGGLAIGGAGRWLLEQLTVWHEPSGPNALVFAAADRWIGAEIRTLMVQAKLPTGRPVPPHALQAAGGRGGNKLQTYTVRLQVRAVAGLAGTEIEMPVVATLCGTDGRSQQVRLVATATGKGES